MNQCKVDYFHSVVAKLLYSVKGVCPDIKPAIAYICTGLLSLTVGGWKKLGRVVVYLEK